MSVKVKRYAEVRNDNQYGRRADYAVIGYWATDIIRVSQDIVYSNGRRWGEVYINWGSGGRDSDECECEVEAASNFAAAMSRATKLAARWKKEEGAPVK